MCVRHLLCDTTGQGKAVKANERPLVWFEYGEPQAQQTANSNQQPATSNLHHLLHFTLPFLCAQCPFSETFDTASSSVHEVHSTFSLSFSLCTHISRTQRDKRTCSLSTWLLFITIR